MPPELPPAVVAALGLAAGVGACGPCLDYAAPTPTADTGAPAETADTGAPAARAAPTGPPELPPLVLEDVLPADVAARLRAKPGAR